MEQRRTIILVNREKFECRRQQSNLVIVNQNSSPRARVGGESGESTPVHNSYHLLSLQSLALSCV